MVNKLDILYRFESSCVSSIQTDVQLKTTGVGYLGFSVLCFSSLFLSAETYPFLGSLFLFLH